MESQVEISKVPENGEEKNYVTSIIKKIQDYDKVMYELQHKVDRLVRENKDQSLENLDDELKETENKEQPKNRITNSEKTDEMIL